MAIGGSRSEERRYLPEDLPDILGFPRVVTSLGHFGDLLEHVGPGVRPVADREDPDQPALALELDATEQRVEAHGAVAIRAVREDDDRRNPRRAWRFRHARVRLID